ncbi:S8 family serine peptidase [Phormidium sp. FACHB-1136]|uniref:S8 family serine peptidase n=1 Tax=Phormidium sp. FACHB-1136 TaxID=2692848 RepID=UPI0016858E77|nr:S8 family serine peptidase [Phormidium sp. FACHB-1136]MBD2427040.1 S8 family serine peptidase [Phormidium sp. FACHB-1136]
MSTTNLPTLPDRVFAEAVVRSASGASLLDSPEAVTSETVDQFLASADTVQAAAQELRSAGFDVIDIGSISITVAASPAVYERALSTHLQAVDRPVIKELQQTATATFISAADAKPFGEVDVSRTPFSQLLDGVALSEPLYYFGCDTPSPTPPQTGQDYLTVPDGVAEGLNALAAHRKGITGKGVKVVMVDSGWYAHPYFAKHNYNVKVVLAPGSTNSATDGLGHGTGESANLLAIAPDIELTMVKADVAISGASKHVNAVSALRKAIELRPDIISCSWGSDQRRRIISPYNRVMGAVIADAVRRGITVVFSAGNGQYGFPGQHPDVISAGGVYRYISGPLKGTLEASNYASSFVSPMYPKRNVPDGCGLVGKLPYGSYLMLPIPPGCEIDQRLSALNDGTKPVDGWAAFSGTSAAAPQIAGVCALLKQLNRDLSPAQIKAILKTTAIDVSDGYSNPSSSGAAARAGPDLATGYGLVDVEKAIAAAPKAPEDACCEPCASQSNFQSEAKSLPSLPTRSTTMSSEFPQLQKHLETIAWELDKRLHELVEKHKLEDIEISINSNSFSKRSAASRSAYYLRENLDICWSLSSNKIEDPSLLEEEHIFAAKGLIKLGKYRETAINFLTNVLIIKLDEETEANLSSTDAKKKKDAEAKKKKLYDIRKLAFEAISECNTEITAFQRRSPKEYEISSQDISVLSDCVVTYDDGETRCVKCAGDEKPKCYRIS